GRTLVQPCRRHIDPRTLSLGVSSRTDRLAGARFRQRTRLHRFHSRGTPGVCKGLGMDRGAIWRVWLPLAGGLWALGWIFQYGPGPTKARGSRKKTVTRVMARADA